MTEGVEGRPPRSALVAVGEELLLGRTVDTNAAWLGGQLSSLGAPVVHKETVGDRDADIRRALHRGLEDAQLVVFTGGLGPTEDDRTRAAVAAGLGLEMDLDEDILAALTARYLKRGYDSLPPANRRQAMVPRGAEVLPNPVGTAPGLVMEAGGGIVALLPGVPRELRALFPSLADAIQRRFSGILRPVHTLTLHTTGIPESVLAPQVEVAMEKAPHEVEVAFLPDLTGVDLRLTVRDRPDDHARTALVETRACLLPVVEPYLIPGDEGDVAAAVLRSLAERNWMLGLGESCTGGLVAKRLTDIPGSSAVVAGGVVAYSNSAKERFLGVPGALLAEHGAVSEPVARAMALGAAEAFEARCGIGVTGVAGPGGGTEAKPVGTVYLAAAVGERVEAELHTFPGDREAVRIRSAQAALALLLRMVREAS